MRDPPAHEAKPTRLKVGVDNDSLEPGLNTLVSALIGQLHSQDETWPRTSIARKGFQAGTGLNVGSGWGRPGLWLRVLWGAGGGSPPARCLDARAGPASLGEELAAPRLPP